MTTSTEATQPTSFDFQGLQRRAAEAAKEKAILVFRRSVLREFRGEEFDEAAGSALADAFAALQFDFPGMTPVEAFNCELSKLRNFEANRKSVSDICAKFGVQSPQEMEKVTADLSAQVDAALTTVVNCKRALAEANGARQSMGACLRLLQEVEQNYPDFQPPQATEDTRGRKRSR